MDASESGRQAMRIAMVGTRGVPARYGGFETCVEEVGSRLVARGHDVVVYCRDGVPGAERLSTHRGMSLVHLPAMRRRSMETLSHTGLSVAHLARHPTDVAVVFNSANAPWLPVLGAANIPVATHVDGLEWKRAKWSGAGQRYYRLAESLSVRWSDALIADAAGIQDYYLAEFGAPTVLLTYGAPLVERGRSDRLAELGLAPGGFHLVVARFEPENHVREMVDGYVRSRSRLPLIVIGSAPYSDQYTREVRKLADGRVRFLGGVWDQGLLDQLYAGCRTYLHGHSVGGTNPSLLRAIGAGAAVVAFDVSFNREVLGGHGRYFAQTSDLPMHLEHAEADPCEVAARGEALRERAAEYDWERVTDGYEQLCRDLVAGVAPNPRDHHHRRRPDAAVQPSDTGGVPVLVDPMVAEVGVHQ